MQCLIWAGPAGAVFAECFVGFVTICPSPRTDISSSLSHLPLAGVVQWQLFLYCHLPEGLGLHWGVSTCLPAGPEGFSFVLCFHVALLRLLQVQEAQLEEFCFYFPLWMRGAACSWFLKEFPECLAWERQRCLSLTWIRAPWEQHLAGCTHWGGIIGELRAGRIPMGIAALLSTPRELRAGRIPMDTAAFLRTGSTHTLGS